MEASRDEPNKIELNIVNILKRKAQYYPSTFIQFKVTLENKSLVDLTDQHKLMICTKED